MKINTLIRKTLSDLTTPVSLYLKLRAQFPEILLLESSDYSSKVNSMSFICFGSLASIKLDDGILSTTKGSDTSQKTDFDIVKELDSFLNSFDFSESSYVSSFNGVFGYSGYESVAQFDTLKVTKSKKDYPTLRYDFFKYIFVFDHFYEQLYLIENLVGNNKSNIDEILSFASRQNHQSFGFSLSGEVSSNMDDAYFLGMVEKAKRHCKRGDVFQMVLSRRFTQGFKGDEFNVYRALRSVNPSPYLFYYDYGSYKIFGSSPEAQLVVQDNIAELHPIAGTFKRTGISAEDLLLGEALKKDPKENAEHIMLVDLARNDLSKNCEHVTVSKLQELQYFSHVIHLTSKVEGQLNKEVSPYQVFADSFPAGTLSGAPKYKAMQLIDQYEPDGRGYYGGAIGWIGFDKRINHAIMIRSFLSINGDLDFQAGAGIVIDSDPTSELEEVKNKLAALIKSLELAQTLK